MTIENNIDNEALTAEQKSNDAKLILAPLAKYAAVAVIMVSVIITTAIMLDRELNTIDQDIASLKAELADANATAEAEAATASNNDIDTETSEIAAAEIATAEIVAAEIAADEIAADKAVADVTEAAIDETVVTAENNLTHTDSNAQPATMTAALAQQPGTATAPAAQTATEVKATTPAQTTELMATSTEPADVTSKQVARPKATQASRIDSLKASMQARIADRNQYLNTLDTQSLEDFKANQQKMIDMMRQQLSHQQKIIDQMRARNQESYDMRAASIKRMQEARDRSLERI